MINLKKIFLIWIFLYSQFAYALSEYPEISSAVNKTSATIGESVEYRVSVSGSDISGFEIVLPEVKNYYVKGSDNKDQDDAREYIPFYSINRARIEKSETEKIKTISAVVEIVFFMPGKHSLPELDVTDYKKENAGYKLPQIEIVELNRNAELEDIEGPLEASRSYTRTVLLAAALLIVCFAAFFALRRLRRNRKENLAEAVGLNPLEIFISDLEHMKAADLVIRGDVMLYAEAVSISFRKFLSSVFRINAADMTAEEIEISLSRLMKRTQKEKYLQDIMSSFRLWDVSKFAGFTPAVETLQLDLEQIRKIAGSVWTGVSNDRV